MLIIRERLMRFRALLSANNHKIKTYSYHGFSLLRLYSFLEESYQFWFICPPVKTTMIRPKGSMVCKAYII